MTVSAASPTPSPTPPPTGWAERVADRSEAVQRSRARQIEQAQAIVAAARRLITERGDQFTTQELVKEAGVALQTFYRIFGGKDHLLLAVFEDLIAESCVDYERAAASLPDPVARLHFYVTVTVGSVSEASYGIGPRFITAEHWRLHQIFPEEMAHATQHFTDLVARQLELANEEGLLVSNDPQRDAWYVTKLVMAVFHHYAYAESPNDAQAIGEELWQFCRLAIGGPVT
jgi:TetR/AcrR family transcriptional regulator